MKSLIPSASKQFHSVVLLEHRALLGSYYASLRFTMWSSPYASRRTPGLFRDALPIEQGAVLGAWTAAMQGNAGGLADHLDGERRGLGRS